MNTHPNQMCLFFHPCTPASASQELPSSFIDELLLIIFHPWTTNNHSKPKKKKKMMRKICFSKITPFHFPLSLFSVAHSFYLPLLLLMIFKQHLRFPLIISFLLVCLFVYWFCFMSTSRLISLLNLGCFSILHFGFVGSRVHKCMHSHTPYLQNCTGWKKKRHIGSG